MTRSKVGVIFGGVSEEHPISVKSAREIARHLDPGKYEPYYVGITEGGAWLLCDGPEPGWEDSGRPVALSPDRSVRGLLVLDRGRYEAIGLDLVFPVLHGRFGEDGAIQGLLELAGIPYVGCDVGSSALCMDKPLAYRVAAGAGIATPEFWTLGAGEEPDPGALAYPVFVKPARSGSSFGVSKVGGADELPGAVDAAREFDPKVVIERAVVGSEVGCALAGSGADLLVGEVDRIALSHGFFRIHQETDPEGGSDNATFIVPADIPDGSRARVRETAKAIYRALGCSGLARVDMFLTGDGEVVLNEVNTFPGMTSYSRYPRMMAAAGVSRAELIDLLVGSALTGGPAVNEGFAYVDERVPGVYWDAKYATWDNFTGKPVDGYRANRIVGTTALCAALERARGRAAELGFGLLLWDGYRPQRAVDSFVRWARQAEDGRTKRRHYPNIERAEMLEKGYVAARSGHSRGSTVDLTLYHLSSGERASMGGDHDLMDETSHHGARWVPQVEARNRRYLRTIMESSGFGSYDCEWWHYALEDEPFPDTYFDFPVE